MDTDQYHNLCVRFKTLALALKDARANRAGYYVGVNDGGTGPSVLFRVDERRGAQTAAVALTASPERDRETGGVVFRVHTVAVVNGSVTGLSVERLPASYDARWKQFTIDTTPPIEEAHIAEFFLQRAERLLELDSLATGTSESNR